MIFRSVLFYLAVIGIASMFFLMKKVQEPPPPPKAVVEPAANPYLYTVAASGIVEAQNENVAIGVPVSGLITNVMVAVWDYVNKEDPLFQIDDRDLQARMQVQKANIEVAKATLNRLRDQLARLQSVKDARAVSIEEVRTRENDVAVAEAELQRTEAEAAETKALIERLTVRAPRDGTILQNNARIGEFAALSPPSPLVILGDISRLQIRADIDEQNAIYIQNGSFATAYPKNNTSLAMPLTFVRIEPFIVPKRSLTGASDERVDTRVLQVIYSFERPKHFAIYVGQQVDVFIELKQPKTSMK